MTVAVGCVPIMLLQRFRLHLMDARRRRPANAGGPPLVAIDTPVEFPEVMCDYKF
jgi:hypothetical protein